MAQAFVSTYRNHYRWNSVPTTPSFNPDKTVQFTAEGDIWKVDLNKEIEEELKNLPRLKEIIQKLYLKRMKTNYRTSHCENLETRKRFKAGTTTSENEEKKEDQDEDDEIGNEMLEYFDKLYSQDEDRLQVQVIPPLQSARNVFGYMRPSRLLTPLTVYQNEYGRVGYNLLKSQNP